MVRDNILAIGYQEKLKKKAQLYDGGDQPLPTFSAELFLVSKSNDVFWFYNKEY